MNPVGNEVSQQSEEARSYRPEVFDDRSSERAIFGGEEFARHHKTWHYYSLKIMTLVRYAFRPSVIILNVIFLPFININVKNFHGSLTTVVRAQNDTSKTANITDPVFDRTLV